MKSEIVAVGMARTPIGSFGGSLRDEVVYDLGAISMRAALERAGIEGAQVDQVIYGNCRQAGNAINPARTASVKAGIVSLLMDLKRTQALTYILITHELALAYRTCDRIAVMHAGRLVELGPAEAVVRTPRHPYSQLLMDSVPPLVPDPGWVALERAAIAPPAADACCPDGCAYYAPCPRKADVCRVKRPPFLDVGTHHFLACHLNAARDDG